MLPLDVDCVVDGATVDVPTIERGGRREPAGPAKSVSDDGAGVGAIVADRVGVGLGVAVAVAIVALLATELE